MEGMPIVHGAGERAVPGEKRIFYADTTKPLISYPAILKISQMKIKPSAWNNNLVALVYLDENGKVTNVIITRGTGDSRLDIEITRILRGASFSPAVTEDGPVPCRFIIEIDI
jgi:TonB family protein